MHHNSSPLDLSKYGIGPVVLEIYDILDSKVLANILAPSLRDMAHKKLHTQKTSRFSKSFGLPNKNKKQKKTNSLSVCNANDEHEVPHHALSPTHRDFGKSQLHIFSSIRRLRGVRLVC